MGSMLECVAKEYSIKEPKLNFDNEDNQEEYNKGSIDKEENFIDDNENEVVPRVDRKRTAIGTGNVNYEQNYLGAEKGVSRTISVRSSKEKQRKKYFG